MNGEIKLSSINTRQVTDILNKCSEGESSSAWFQLLAETTLSAQEMAMAAAHWQRNELDAVLPLAVHGTQARALTAPYTTAFAPAGQPAGCRRLGAALRELGLTRLRLDALDLEDPCTGAFCEGLVEGGWAVAFYRHFANWFEPFEDLETYWRARPSRLRTTVRRKQSKFTTRAAEFELACTPRDLKDAFSAYQAVYAASWKEPEPHRAFMPELVSRLGAAGSIRMGVLKLDGIPVAAQIWLACRGKATLFKLAHRDDAAQHSPGTVLTAWMLEKLAERGELRCLDFGRGNDTYKRDWMGQVRVRYGLVAADWRSLDGMRCMLTEVMPTRLATVVRRVLRTAGKGAL